MTPSNKLLAACAWLALMTAAPCWAESSLASSASDSVSTSVGSLSNSIQGSSDSSSKGNKVAEGDYRIIEVDVVAERPGSARMKLQAVAGDGGEFFLFVPQQLVEQDRLERGQIVTARQRPYGLEFARAGEAFFLALEDGWVRELQSRVVTL